MSIKRPRQLTEKCSTNSGKFMQCLATNPLHTATCASDRSPFLLARVLRARSSAHLAPRRPSGRGDPQARKRTPRNLQTQILLKLQEVELGSNLGPSAAKLGPKPSTMT